LNPSINLSSIIQTSEGSYAGLIKEDIISWKGIRYAEPPKGDLRWRPPQLPVKFSEIKKAHHYGNICPQRPYGTSSIYENPSETQSEDCLFLNIWSKEKTQNTKKPVLVWIHGGRFKRESGSSAIYSGHYLAKKDVVFVNFNYRLNVFGFFAHPDLVKENPDDFIGNYGILDQIMALKWIKKNIAKFHGDPNNITLIGESAGAWSISLLMATDSAKGLFNKVILQSGSYLWKGPHLLNQNCTYNSAIEEGQELAKLLETENIDELRKISQEKLIDLVFSDNNPLSLEPIIDGRLFRDYIPQIYEQGRVNKCDILIGTNADEWTVFTKNKPDEFFYNFENSLNRRFILGYRLWIKTYAPNKRSNLRVAFNNYYADLVFNFHSINLANYATNWGSNAYVYYFDKKSINSELMDLGSFHGAEIPFVLQTFEHDIYNKNIPMDVRKYADVLSDYWINFAKNGSPNSEDLVHWPLWHTETQKCMLFKETIAAEIHPLKERLEGLSKFLAQEPDQKRIGIILKSLEP